MSEWSTDTDALCEARGARCRLDVVVEDHPYPPASATHRPMETEVIAFCLGR